MILRAFEFVCVMSAGYTAISRNVLSEKSTKAHATRPKGGLGSYYILHIGKKEMYKFVFLHVKNLFFLSGGLYL